MADDVATDDIPNPNMDIMKHAFASEPVKFRQAFDNAMLDKLSTALGDKHQHVVGQIFGDEEPDIDDDPNIDLETGEVDDDYTGAEVEVEPDELEPEEQPEESETELESDEDVQTDS